MAKVNEFYAAAMADEAAKAKIEAILGEDEIEDATDAQLLQIGEIAKEMGYEITLEDAKAYLETEEAIPLEVMDNAAGGASKITFCSGQNSGNASGNGRARAQR